MFVGVCGIGVFWCGLLFWDVSLRWGLGLGFFGEEFV